MNAKVRALSPRKQFERDGFFFSPPLLPAELVDRAVRHINKVMACKYETGVPVAGRHWNPGEDPFKIRKIDEPQRADRTILEVIGHPEIGKWAAKLTGAKMVQAWACQLLYKPAGGKEAGSIGWHQDQQYWDYWDGEVFTAWIALSDVTADAGPMRFVRGSNHWGLRISATDGDFGNTFFNADHEAVRQRMQPKGKKWEEVPAILPPGAVSFHHRYTIHGSSANRSGRPRISLAVHLRTEKTRMTRDKPDLFQSSLENPAFNPVLYRAKK
ncbi:MAG TPA: phytanoyl-CoA dioxygenase family protein [Tepidisphaeraceae bacterium]|jgi:hypothetical protein